jgi:hypothetical protein
VVSASERRPSWAYGGSVREIEKEVDAFITRQWLFTQMVLCGECIEIGAADGWYVLQGDEVVALIT